MNKQSIKKHLSIYSIFQKRKTTINHAFASALAPNDQYDEQIIDNALRHLGQNPEEHLKCVYCGNLAETWDHLVGLVKNSEFRGFGHQIGNLVPCCKRCNSKKGSKDWRKFIQIEITDELERGKLEEQLEKHIQTYAKYLDLDQIKQKIPQELVRYNELKEQIFNLMREADEVAQMIRNKGR